MHITMIALGTRGDVQPAIALGKGLQQAGHTVRIIAGENFAGWVQSYGFEFAGALDMETLMKSPDGVIWSESSDNPLRQLKIMKRLLNTHGKEMLGPFVEYIKGTDLLLSGFVSEPYAQSVAEKHRIPHISVPLQPYHATRSASATMAAITPFDSVLNRWLGRLTEWLLWSTANETTNTLRTMLDLPPHTFKSYRRAVRAIPVVFGFSEHVVPMPSDWGSHRHISGYWFLDEQSDWQPSDELTQFLAAGDTPVYVGFGSMSSSDPLMTFNMVSNALERAGQRGIMVRGWNIDRDFDMPPHMCLLDSVPHSWLFERVKAVVHHGGAGTTAAGLRVGKPTFIIPHMSDQPFWGNRVHKLGVGVRPIMRHKINLNNLSKAIQELVNDAAIHDAAAKLGERIRAEDGVSRAVAYIDQIMA